MSARAGVFFLLLDDAAVVQLNRRTAAVERGVAVAVTIAVAVAGRARRRDNMLNTQLKVLLKRVLENRRNN